MLRSDVYTGVTAEAMALTAARQTVQETRSERVAELFEAHHERLYRLARRMSGSAEEARDLVQDTFVRAARTVNSVPAGERAEAAWLVRVLVNLCRDGWRQQARTRRGQATAAPPIEASAHPEAALIAHDTIWRALRQLPPRQRAAIVMYELDGVGIREIATALGVTAVTVRWHLSRGRRELARTIRGTRLAPPVGAMEGDEEVAHE